MSCMSNLRDVLQLVIDGFDDGSLAKQNLVYQGHQAILHVLANRRNQLNTLFKELVKQWLRDVAFIAKQFTPQLLGHMGHRLAVIHMHQIFQNIWRESHSGNTTRLKRGS